ncbi:MAG: hypothetical protein E6559_22285, partial [Pantoea sp.]|nr:hypothetical protein [Pantoea sp.]
PIGGFQDRCLKPLGHPSAMRRTINIPPKDVKPVRIHSPEKQTKWRYSLAKSPFRSEKQRFIA